MEKAPAPQRASEKSERARPQPRNPERTITAAPCGDLVDQLGNRGMLALLNSSNLQRKASSSPPPPPAAATTSVPSGGRPIDRGTLDRLEPHFGRDFSEVRVHDDASAHQAAASVRADAFTVGKDIVFGRGHFAPDTGAGTRLLAHELTHVAQQAGGDGALQGYGLSHDHYEAEADRAADRAVSGHAVEAITPLRGKSVQRQPTTPPAANAHPPLSLTYPALINGLDDGQLIGLENASDARYVHQGAADAEVDPTTLALATPSVVAPLGNLLTDEAQFVDEDIWETLYALLRRHAGDALTSEVLRNEMMRRYFQAATLTQQDPVTIELIDPDGLTPGASQLRFTVGEHVVHDTEGLISALNLSDGITPLQPSINAVNSDGTHVALAAALVDELEDVTPVVDRLFTDVPANPGNHALNEVLGVSRRLTTDQPHVDDYGCSTGPEVAAAAGVITSYQALRRKMDTTVTFARTWHTDHPLGESLGQMNTRAGTWLVSHASDQIDEGGVGHSVLGGLAYAGAFLVAFVDAGESVLSMGYHGTATAVSEAYMSGDISYSESEQILRSAFWRALLVAALTRGVAGAASKFGAGFATGLGLAVRSTSFGVVTGTIAGGISSASGLAAQSLLTHDMASRFSNPTARGIINMGMPSGTDWAIGMAGGTFMGGLGGARAIQAGNARAIGTIVDAGGTPMRIVAINNSTGVEILQRITTATPRVTPYGSMRVITVLPNGTEVLEGSGLTVTGGAPSGGSSLVRVPSGWRPTAIAAPARLPARPGSIILAPDAPIPTGDSPQAFGTSQPLLLTAGGDPLLTGDGITPFDATAPSFGAPSGIDLSLFGGNSPALGPTTGSTAMVPATPRYMVQQYLQAMHAGAPSSPGALTAGFDAAAHPVQPSFNDILGLGPQQSNPLSPFDFNGGQGGFTPRGLLTSGPQPFGLLGPGPQPFALLGAGPPAAPMMPARSPRPFALRGPNPQRTSFILEPAPGDTGTNYFGTPVVRFPGHLGSPLDPPMSAAPILRRGPFTDAQRAGFLAGNDGGTLVTPHHRHQLSINASGGIFDELPRYGHPEGNIHLTGPRHPGPSYFYNTPGGDALRDAEITVFFRAKGARLVQVGPDEWIDPGL